MELDSGRWLSKMTRTRSPWLTWMVGPGALPLKPQRSSVRLGRMDCLTGSAMRWKTLTPLSTVNGRSRTSGVVTGTLRAVPLPGAGGVLLCQFEDGACGAGLRTAAGGFIGEETGRSAEAGAEPCTEAEGALEKAAAIAAWIAAWIATLIRHGVEIPCCVKKTRHSRAHGCAGSASGVGYLDAQRNGVGEVKLAGRRAVGVCSEVAAILWQRFCRNGGERGRIVRRGHACAEDRGDDFRRLRRGANRGAARMTADRGAYAMMRCGRGLHRAMRSCGQARYAAGRARQRGKHEQENQRESELCPARHRVQFSLPGLLEGCKLSHCGCVKVGHRPAGSATSLDRPSQTRDAWQITSGRGRAATALRRRKAATGRSWRRGCGG